MKTDDYSKLITDAIEMLIMNGSIFQGELKQRFGVNSEGVPSIKIGKYITGVPICRTVVVEVFINGNVLWKTVISPQVDGSFSQEAVSFAYVAIVTEMMAHGIRTQSRVYIADIRNGKFD